MRLSQTHPSCSTVSLVAFCWRARGPDQDKQTQSATTDRHAYRCRHSNQHSDRQRFKIKHTSIKKTATSKCPNEAHTQNESPATMKLLTRLWGECLTSSKSRSADTIVLGWGGVRRSGHLGKGAAAGAVGAGGGGRGRRRGRGFSCSIFLLGIRPPSPIDS